MSQEAQVRLSSEETGEKSKSKMAAVEQNLQLKTRQAAAVIDGIHTDILCTWYSDRVFVVVTQFQKFGTLVSISKDQSMSRNFLSNGEQSKQQTFTTKVLMGKDEPIWHVYGQQIASAVSDAEECSHPVLLAIALKRHSPGVLRRIVEQIKSIKARKET